MLLLIIFSLLIIQTASGTIFIILDTFKNFFNLNNDFIDNICDKL